MPESDSADPITELFRMDEPKRIAGLLMEMFFERKIFTYLAGKDPGGSFSTGWLMGRHDGYDIALRECTAPLQDADKKFMEHLQRGRWEIVQFHFADQRFSALGDSPGWFRNCVNTANNILLSKTLTSGKKADQRLKDNRKVHGDFFSRMSEADIRHAWQSRTILNVLMETGLIRLIKDIDAIAYNERRGLRVFEFKRKYPARGYYRFQEPAQFGRLPEIPAIRDISPELIKQAAFGLDRGHALTLEVCRKLQIGYVYLILNSIETRPEHFFDESFRSRQPHELLYRSVELRDLVGYHSTDGKDSGSFNRNKRWQYMIDRKVFEEYTLPAG